MPAKHPIKVCRFNGAPPWEEKHAAFRNVEAIWPQAVEERGQSFILDNYSLTTL
jgi:hypothetical protein